MPTYAKSLVTSKKGINYVRGVIEGVGCLFQKIEQENDLGIDAICELINSNGQPENHLFALQIKSGDSYYDSSKNSCSFRIGTHRDYWTNYKVPLFAVVYIPSLDTAYWTDIKKFLKSNVHASSISFDLSRANHFDEEKFISYFKPLVTGRGPNISLEDSLRLVRSSNDDEAWLGLTTLFRRFPNTYQTWDELVRAFKIRSIAKIPRLLIYLLAHIPWHGDISYSGEEIKSEIRCYAADLFNSFDEGDIRKLLSMIDDNGIQRGAIGQSVEAVINCVGSASQYLIRIIRNGCDSMELRESAAFILAVDKGVEAIPYLRELASSGSEISSLIIQDIAEHGGFYPYS
ncbi:DUF4365 domain-containing protein [Shewanella baltica]|uniref:DUF4365 domain-containing protein n=1 Tax=Shewanella TaxID=22 RepID=UPI00217DEB3F|nr:DUF4365 domain-containing protein [Shewanella baltica]MCS6207461.1 DUF4365 domain-containing protein [Shewanella baltica]